MARSLREIAFFLCLLSSRALYAQEDSWAWLAFGDLRGHWESCGCDPRTDLGGVDRLAAYLEREKQVEPAALVFDLGNNFGASHAAPLKTRYMALGLSRLPLTAALVSASEFSLEPGLWQDRPLVLSNGAVTLKPGLVRPLVLQKSQPYLLRPHSLIFGYLWQDDLAPYLRRWDKSLEQEIARRCSEQPGSKPLLLFRGPDAHLRAAVQTGLFKQIISANPRPESAQPDFREKEGVLSLERTIGSVSVPLVPLGGLGVLRGGRLKQRKEVVSLNELLAQPSKQSQHRGVSRVALALDSGPQAASLLPAALSAYYPVSWLGASYARSGPLLDLVAQFEKEAREQFAKRSYERLAQLDTSPFAGAVVCGSCHPQAFKAWQASKHAQAYDTLKKAQKHEDPACVGCHVVGFDRPGGFASEHASPQFVGVQCENCHGAAREHSQNPAAKKPAGKADFSTCVSCHHNPHSPAFKPAAYWEKIKH